VGRSQKKTSDTVIEIWDFVELERLLLKFQSQLAIAFPELFPQSEVVKELAKVVIDELKDILLGTSIATSSVDIFTPNTTFKAGSSESWKLGFFTFGDIHDDYDARNPIIDELISSIETHSGTFLFGKSHTGKSTIVKRIIIEEIERGYIILNISDTKANANQLNNLFSSFSEKYKRILVIADNNSNLEIFKSYNIVTNNKIKFLFTSIREEFEALKELLYRDESTELEVTFSEFNVINLRFEKSDAQRYIEKSFKIFRLQHPNCSMLAEELYNRSEKDPLMFSYALIHILTSGKVESPSGPAIQYLQKHFNEVRKKLKEDPSATGSAIFCLFLGMLGFKINMDLLEKCNIYSDDLVKLKQIGIVFKDREKYEVRHPEWDRELLKYIISKDFDDHWNSFYSRSNINLLLESLSEYLPLSLKSIMFNRLAILAIDFEIKEFCTLIVEKFPIPNTISPFEKSDLLCYCHADFYKKIKDYEKAKEYYKEAIRLNPRSDGAYNNLGIILEEEGDLTEAIHCYEKTMEINKNDSIAAYNKGRLLNRLKKYPEAIIFLKRSIRLDPFYEGAYIEIGNAFNSLEMLDDAISFYKIAIQQNPLYVDAWVSIGSAWMLLEDHVKANIYFEKAKKIDPNNAYVWYAKGLMFASTNYVSGALSHFRKSVELGLNYTTQLGEMYNYFKSHGDNKFANICLNRMRIVVGEITN
jgi:tetratricopeptide (TPR) repeat protein